MQALMLAGDLTLTFQIFQNMFEIDFGAALNTKMTRDFALANFGGTLARMGLFGALAGNKGHDLFA